jgi:carboxylesterase type B
MHRVISLLITAIVAAVYTQVATTPQGTYRGQLSPFIPIAFWYSIPYAQAPTGSNRWKPPLPITVQSNATVNAFIPVACPQESSSGIPQSEDCLVLNIWAPTNKQNLPVYVWIHGGSFTSGSGAIYNGTGLVAASLSNSSPIIVVSINYRLGILGFLVDQELYDEKSADGKSTTGNYGFLDQVQAIKWVKANIASFGGNPNDITIGGESAGGACVMMHRVSPVVPAGLFQKVIIESGAIYPDTSMTVAATLARGVDVAIRKVLNCTTLTCLRNVPYQQIVAAGLNTEESNIFGAASTPTIDGYALTESVYTSISKGSFVKTPLLIGSNTNETSLFTCPVLPDNTTQAQVDQYLVTLFGSNVTAQLSQFYNAASYEEPVNYLNTVYSDSWLHCSSRRVAAASANSGQNTYLYTFNHVFPQLDKCLGSAHAFEVAFLFPYDLFQISLFGRTFTPAETDLSNTMLTYWANFIANGDPNKQALGAWAKYDQSSDRDLMLATEPMSAVRTGYYRNVCDNLWDKLASGANIAGDNNAREASASRIGVSAFVAATLLLSVLLL